MAPAAPPGYSLFQFPGGRYEFRVSGRRYAATADIALYGIAPEPGGLRAFGYGA